MISLLLLRQDERRPPPIRPLAASLVSLLAVVYSGPNSILIHAVMLPRLRAQSSITLLPAAVIPAGTTIDGSESSHTGIQCGAQQLSRWRQHAA